MDWKVVTLVIPMFLTIAIGGVLRKTKILEEGFVTGGNRLVFHVLMPLYLFTSIYGTEDFKGMDFNVVFYILAVYLILFIGGLLVLRKSSFDLDSRGIVLQCIIRPNLLLFGIYLAQSFYGEQGAAAAVVPIVFAAPITNLLGVLTYELTLYGKLPLKKLLKSILINEMVIAFMGAILFKVLEIPVPSVLLNVMKDLGGMTTGIGLLVIGAGLKREEIRLTKELTVTALMRNFIIPAVMIPIAILLGFRDQGLFAISIMALAPAAVTSYSFAKHYTKKAYIASNIVMVTTLLSIASIVIALSLLLQFGWIGA